MNQSLTRSESNSDQQFSSCIVSIWFTPALSQVKGSSLVDVIITGDPHPKKSQEKTTQMCFKKNHQGLNWPVLNVSPLPKIETHSYSGSSPSIF